MDTKLKNTIETSITIISLIASVIGMGYIGFATWQFLSTHYENAVQLLIKLF